MASNYNYYDNRNNNNQRINNRYSNNRRNYDQYKEFDELNELSDFDYVCVVDYEATCNDNSLNYPHEIIEFPIVLINMSTMQIEDCFQEYVRPVINPILTKYCKDLTGITQNMVDNANTFPEVLENVKQWLMMKKLGTRYKFAIATDGPWDFEKFLSLQCNHSDITYPYWATRYIDVRKMFAFWFGVRRCSIDNMLAQLNLEFEGKPHSGLDDARNIARILLALMNNSCRVTFNSIIKNWRSIDYKYHKIPQFHGYLHPYQY